MLSYVLLLGVDKCGFVLPGQQTLLKNMRGTDFLKLNAPLMQEVKYYELILGNTIAASEIEKLL